MLTIETDPPLSLLLPFPAAVSFGFVHAVSRGGPGGTWFRILNPATGTLLLAGVDANALDLPPSGVPPRDGFFAPLSLRLSVGLCPAHPATCGELQRAALEVTSSAGTVRVYGGGWDAIPGGEGYIFLPQCDWTRIVGCADYPELHLRALFYRSGEG